MKVEPLSDIIGYLDEKISQHNVKKAVLFHLNAYSKVGWERWIQERAVKQKRRNSS